MPWITVTEDDLLTVINGKELAGYRAAALAQGQADPISPAINQVIDLVRGYVGACRSNTLGEGNTIPSKLLAPACDLIVVRVMGRIMRVPDAARKDAADRATTLLEQVAKCQFDVESPVVAASEPSAAPSPHICTPKLRFRDQD